MNTHTRTPPDKPYPGFPLFPHQNGQWCKKIKCKLHYFGLWDDWQAALSKYNQDRDDLYAGRTPRRVEEATQTTVGDLVNAFLNAKRKAMEKGELSPATFDDYKTAGERVAKLLRKHIVVNRLRQQDFDAMMGKWPKKWGPVTRANEVQRVRILFKYAFDAELIDKPVRFGPTFKRPSKKVLRQARQSKGKRMFSAREIVALLALAPVHIEAMTLLGINCGFGNNDVSMLEFRHLDLVSGVVDFPRPKTAVERKCFLWPETVQALKEAIAVRREPKSPADAEYVFITKRGYRWNRYIQASGVCHEFRKLCDSLDELKTMKIRAGLNFYALRHTFETVAGKSKDQVAVDMVMGHADGSMAGQYREEVGDDRLKAVSDFVRDWLFRRTQPSPLASSASAAAAPAPQSLPPNRASAVLGTPQDL